MNPLTRAIASYIDRYRNRSGARMRGGNRPPGAEDPASHNLQRLNAGAIERLNVAVRRSGLTSERLALQANCSVSYLAELLDGSREWIHPEILLDLARELKTFPGWIVDGEPDPGEAFAQRLFELRKARKWSREKLTSEIRALDPIGLHPEHIRRLERGRVKLPREETLRLLATVFGVTTNYLLHGTDEAPTVPAPTQTRPAPWKRPLRRRNIALAGSAFALALAAVAVAFRANRSEPRWAHPSLIEMRVANEGRRIEAVDPFLNSEKWAVDYRVRVARHESAVWNGERVLMVGLEGRDHEQNGAFFVYRVATGEAIVADLLDHGERMERVRAVGPVGHDRTLSWQRYRSSVKARMFADLDGDGIDELIVPFAPLDHAGLSRIRVYAGNGSVRGSYYVSGEVTFHLAADFDGDGRDEILLAATSSHPAEQGFSLIVLDQDHLSGASPDLVSDPDCRLADNSLAGVWFPAFDEPIMNALPRGSVKSWETRLLPEGSDDRARFLVWVGTDAPVLLYLDGALKPLRVEQSDAFRSRVSSRAPDLPATEVANLLSNWSSRYERWGAGRVDRPQRGEESREPRPARADIATTSSNPAGETSSSPDRPNGKSPHDAPRD